MEENTEDPVSSKVETAPEAESPKAESLTLRRGMKLECGYRRGTVQYVRGSWDKPYDVRVHWDHEKCPQWITFRTLELNHEQGTLKVLGR